MTDRVLRLGTRGSPLARAQSGHVRDALERRHPGLRVEMIYIRTTGDQLQRGPLPAGGKGLFVKEIEEALWTHTIDVGVHSMKDMPARLPEGLLLAGVPARADARDVLVGAGAGDVGDLPRGVRVGTGSVRRRALLLACRRDLDVIHVRGNVDTRLGKWRAGEVDALVLAAAGLDRLGVREPAARPIPTETLLPAVGQGALALECRADDASTRELVGGIADPATTTATAAERAFLVGIGGDCNTPLAAYAEVVGGVVSLRVLVTDVEGTQILAEHVRGPSADAEALGRSVAERLLARGAAAVMAR